MELTNSNDQVGYKDRTSAAISPESQTIDFSNRFANKVHIFKAMVFPVVMYGCESWTIKEAEGQRIHIFEL